MKCDCDIGEVVIEDYSLPLDQKDYFTSTKQDANS